MVQKYDVVVVGSGNAGFAAALSAATRGRKTALLEKGAYGMHGGNSYYTAGASRIIHNGLSELQEFIEPDERHSVTTVPPYTEEDYLSDLEKVTGGKGDTRMAKIVAKESQSTLRWLHDLGMKYRLMYERQAYENADGTYLFWGGLHVGNVGGGEGMIENYLDVVKDYDIDVKFDAGVSSLLEKDGTVYGVVVTPANGESYEIHAESVILASGGFEASAEMRQRFLGEGWQNAKVRGTPYNTGDLMVHAMDELAAAPHGDWTTCHSTQWDAFHPDNESNRELTNRLTRQGYPLGIIVNREGKRFVDEGEDFRNYTYAKFGAEVLKQPDSIAYQIFDADLRKVLRTEEYDIPNISVEVADTLEELAAKLGIPADAFTDTVNTFNANIDTSKTYNPNIKDGRKSNVTPVKSNWATAIDQGPYYGYAVTCGITFTFGGLHGDDHGRVLTTNGDIIPGLFAVGEALGGLFSKNYPGGTGLVAGFVFGKRAGSVA